MSGTEVARLGDMAAAIRSVPALLWDCVARAMSSPNGGRPSDMLASARAGAAPSPLWCDDQTVIGGAFGTLGLLFFLTFVGHLG